MAAPVAELYKGDVISLFCAQNALGTGTAQPQRRTESRAAPYVWFMVRLHLKMAAHSLLPGPQMPRTRAEKPPVETPRICPRPDVEDRWALP